MKKAVIVLLFFIVFQPLFGKMDGWKFFKDREGNTYYLDPAGKIFITDSTAVKFGAISSKGIDYHYHNALDLLKSGLNKEGLQILKSIMVIPEGNNRLIDIQAKASQSIKKLKSKHGSRFEKFNRDAALLLYSSAGKNFLINDLMFYKIKIPGSVEILSVRKKEQVNRLYSGITFGVKLNPEKTGSRFDMLIAIDSEKLNYMFNNLKELNDNWSINLGDENLKRDILKSEKNYIIRSYLSKAEPVYGGYESISYNKNYSYFVRIIAPEKFLEKNKNVMKEIIEGFSPVMI